ncbi:MAG TPA: signal peptidase II [Polyangia bacterium]|jgi:signal peptidase II|nr:signal peptidase II [Polyangia bacterium]
MTASSREQEPQSEAATTPPGSRKYLLFGFFSVLSIALDQWTKVLARQTLKGLDPRSPRVIVDGFFNLRYSENSGVAFGMLQQMAGGRIFLTVMAVGAFGLVVYYLHKTPPRATRLHVALGLIGGGAIGNLIDRVQYGRVTDFIVWHYKQHEWPAFNIADAALCIGVGLMVLDMILSKPEPAKSA